MPLTVVDFNQPLARREEAARGNVVVWGSGPLAHLHALGIQVRTSHGPIGPALTDAGTRAIVLIVDDVEVARRRVEELREWAHDSVLPLLAWVRSPEAVEDPLLWRGALTCAVRGLEDARLLRLLTALDRGRRGLPSDEDAELTWNIQRQLDEPAERLGHGLGVFVGGGTVFVGGQLHPGISIERLMHTLDVPGHVRIDTHGLRSATCGR